MEKLEMLMENEDFQEEIIKIESAEDVKKLFVKYEISKDEELSWDDIFAGFVKAKADSKDDEISEEELGQVAGGSVTKTQMRAFRLGVIAGKLVARELSKYSLRTLLIQAKE